MSVDGAGVEHREPKLHHVFGQLRQYDTVFRLYLTEFGLTAASRGRVRMPGDANKPANMFSQFGAPRNRPE